MSKKPKKEITRPRITREQRDLINFYCEQNGYSHYSLAKVIDIQPDTISKILKCDYGDVPVLWNTVYEFETFIRDKKLKERKIAYYYNDETAMQDTEENVEKYGVVGGPVTSYKKVYKHLNKVENDIDEHGYCILDFDRVNELKRYCEHFRISCNELTYELRLSYPTIKRFWNGELRVSYATYKAVNDFIDKHIIKKS